MKIAPCFLVAMAAFMLAGCAQHNARDSTRQKRFANFFTRGKPALIKIIEEPEDLLVMKGSNATFSVKAAPEGVNYQWRLNGTAIPGATTNNLTIASVNSAHVGRYTCELSTLYQTVTVEAFLSAYGFSATNSALITIESGDYTGNPALGVGCPYPYVARVRFPAGLATSTKVPSLPASSYWVHEPSGAPHKIAWQGNSFLDRGCKTNGPVIIPTGTSTKFYFTVYYITTPSAPYLLNVSGFN